MANVPYSTMSASASQPNSSRASPSPPHNPLHHHLLLNVYSIRPLPQHANLLRPNANPPEHNPTRIFRLRNLLPSSLAARRFAGVL